MTSDPKPTETTTETDDTDGSSMHWSDADVKHDVTPVGPKAKAEDETEDTEGSGFKFPAPDEATADDTEGSGLVHHGVSSEGETDDTDGNGIRWGG